MRKKRSLTDTSRYFYLFISPWILGFLLFTLIPMLFSLFVSFMKWDGIKPPSFIAFKNYVNAIKLDGLFKKGLLNTLAYVAMAVPLNTVLSIILALMLNKRLPASNIFRSVFYLPTICTGVAWYITWLYLYNQQTGFINVFLDKFGIVGPGWLTDMNISLLSLVIMDTFACGTSMTIILASLQNVPQSYYEAAEIDGAKAWKKFWMITFPMISPVVFFNVLMSLIKGVQIFTQPYVMTDGGPANSTYVYGLHLYKSAFLYSKFGYASAMAWILFVVLILLSLFIMFTSKFWVFYREDVD